MIPNHHLTEDGHIQQTVIDYEAQSKIYGVEYNGKYNAPMYDNNLSLLRLGFVAGVLGRYPKSILDIGYGNGDFLFQCAKKIDLCFGYDISEYPTPKGVTKITSIDSCKAEVVTFWDSLEHIEDLSFVKDLKCEYVIISCPMSHWNFFDTTEKADNWLLNHRHYRPNEHLHYFDDMSLTIFMNMNGFDYICDNNLEDLIRIPGDDRQNILTAAFKKRK